MRKKKGLIFLLLLVASITFYYTYINFKAPYNISEDNVKLMYCEYFMGGTKIIPVSETDKKTILPEISKMRKSNTNGEVGTVPYRFIIELTNGDKFVFIQNTSKVISLYLDKGNFYRKIRAPKTEEFIKRFIEENNFEI
jgi:hypothetical protein